MAQDPRHPNPSVEDLMRVDHQELRALVVELRRRPPTPGVVRSLFHGLGRRLDAHLDAVTDVLVADIARRLDPRLADGMRHDHEELRTQLRRLQQALDAPSVDGFVELLDHHEQLECDRLVPQLRSETGEAHMATLADALDHRRDSTAGF